MRHVYNWGRVLLSCGNCRGCKWKIAIGRHGIALCREFHLARLCANGHHNAAHVSAAVFNQILPPKPNYYRPLTPLYREKYNGQINSVFKQFRSWRYQFFSFFVISMGFVENKFTKVRQLYIFLEYCKIEKTSSFSSTCKRMNTEKNELWFPDAIEH